MIKSFRSPVWPALRKIICCTAIFCGLYATATTKAEASASCDAVNTGAFNFSNPAFDIGNSSILTSWAVGDKITVTFTDAVGFSHADGLYSGPLNTIAALQTVTVPSGGSAGFTYTVMPSDLSSGILVDPENNDSVTATCVASTLIQTTTALNASPNPSVFGQLVSLTATVSSGGGTPTGSVTFKDGSTTIGSSTLAGGSGSTTVSSLSVGTHSLTAVYSGDASFATSASAPVTQTVNKGATAAVVSGAPNPGILGQPVTFTATISAAPPAAGLPTGTVTFKDGATSLGGATLAGGSASFTTSALTLGTHSITAIYGGDGNFNGSTSSALSEIIGVARAWVSAVGTDSGACPRDTPCQTFSYAVSVTVAGGEIDALDPGDFGTVAISKAITLDAGGGQVSSSLASATNGIVVSAGASDIVIIRNVRLNGISQSGAPGLNGISFSSGKVLIVDHCDIFDWQNSGIDFEPRTTSKLTVTDTHIRNTATQTGNAAILVKPSGSANVSAAITRVVMTNQLNGVFADGSVGTGIVHINVMNSVVTASSNSGIVISSGGGAYTGDVFNTLISYSVNTGAAVAGASATLKLGNNTITNNVTGVTSLGGTLQSFKNNMITDNSSDGTPITAVPGYSGTGQ